jgi:hypothetical protein
VTLIDTVLPDGTILPGCRRDLLNVGDLWARGWSLIPLKPRSKVPAVKWEAYQRRHATYDELESWFTMPGFNVGIVTGALSGLFVVDADSASALRWVDAHLPPCNLRVRTSKGLHLYFPYTGDRPIKNRVRVKVDGQPLEIDLRGDGGFVVGPGSVHPSGFIYTREGSGWC